MFKEIQKELKTQDNMGTENPIFIVYDVEKVPANPLYVDDFEYADTYDGYDPIGITKEDLINFAKESEIELPCKADLDEMEHGDLFTYLEGKCDTLIRNHYIEKNVYQNVFFTRKSAQEFIKQNKHHFTKEVFIYTASLWRNPEMRGIRKALLNGCVKSQSEVKE